MSKIQFNILECFIGYVSSTLYDQRFSKDSSGEIAAEDITDEFKTYFNNEISSKGKFIIPWNFGNDKTSPFGFTGLKYSDQDYIETKNYYRKMSLQVEIVMPDGKKTTERYIIINGEGWNIAGNTSPAAQEDLIFDTDQKSWIGGLLNSILPTIGVSDPNTIKKVTDFVDQNPALSTAIAIGGGGLIFKIGSQLISGQVPSVGDLATYGLDIAKWAALAGITGAVVNAGTSGGGLGSLFGGGIVPGAMGALFGPEAMGTFIAYDGGKEVDNKSTAPYQRCLIRLGKGNLAMERANLQPPAYNPVIGIKVPGKKNYADDGRFGQWTLDASRNMFQTINTLNKDKIKDNPKFEIKDPARVPVEILISPACAGNTQMNPTATEQQAFDTATKKPPTPSTAPVAKKLQESKVYKEYGFLSTKNEKLHSVLMEQLKKDLKRG